MDFALDILRVVVDGMRKRMLACCLTLVLLFASGITVFARTPTQARDAVLTYLMNSVTAPTVNPVNGEWAVLALARGSANVPAGYFDAYINRVRQTLQNNGGTLPGPITEYARVVIALSALGADVANFYGHNLLLPLADFYEVTAQGINGAIFTLIAFDTRDWEIPQIADTNAQITRQRLIDFILGSEITDGGFHLNPNFTTPMPDITAMALQALAPYQSQEAVAGVISRGLIVLENATLANAGDAAQVVVARVTLGYAPGNALDALLALQQQNGSFLHVAAGTGNRHMATEQAAYALVAYHRFANGQTALYDMSDVPPRETGNGTQPPIWWETLPVWLQWTLRYLFFGWIWMR